MTEVAGQRLGELAEALGLEVRSSSADEVMQACISEAHKLRVFADWYLRLAAEGAVPAPPADWRGTRSSAGVVSGTVGSVFGSEEGT